MKLDRGDDLRSIDKCRIRRFYGQLGKDQLARVDQGLALFLGFGSEPQP